MRVDLNDAGTAQLAQSVKKRCTGIPRYWPIKEASQAQAEHYIKRDQGDTTNCAAASLAYVGHIEGRDTALTGKKR